MQTSELEKKKNNLLGEEECINFRPSPNFKNMRKYLKSKFEEANSSPNQSSDPSTTPNSEEQDTVKPLTGTSSSMAQRVQPPLPPNSPPPELVVPKQEIEDDSYNDRPSQTAKVDVADKPAKTMCRQFIRGTCVRGAACIYVHEVILDQLPGVYTFCKNFQNKECKLAKCKFVHATVFEKEHFYRTGFLPPHTLTHLKESNSALAPASLLEGPAEAAPMFTNPPPSMLPGLSTLPTSGSSPDGRANPDVFGNGLTALKQSSPAKREWTEMELAMAAYDIDCKEPMPKKCKPCNVTKARIQCCKEAMEKMEHEIKIYKQQNIQLRKRMNKLEILIDLVLRANNIGPSFTNWLSSAMAKSDQDVLLEQMRLFLKVSNNLSADISEKTLLKRLLKEYFERLEKKHT